MDDFYILTFLIRGLTDSVHFNECKFLNIGFLVHNEVNYDYNP